MLTCSAPGAWNLCAPLVDRLQLYSSRCATKRPSCQLQKLVIVLYEGECEEDDEFVSAGQLFYVRCSRNRTELLTVFSCHFTLFVFDSLLYNIHFKSIIISIRQLILPSVQWSDLVEVFLAPSSIQTF